MPSFRTLFRAVVMVAVGAVAFKGWHLYGPTNEQVKSAVTQALDMAHSAMQSREASNTRSTPDPRLTPQVGSDTALPAPIAAAPFPPLTAQPVPGDAPKLLANVAQAPEALASQEPITPVGGVPAQGLATTGDRMPELMSRLQQLGAADTNLASWGNDGHMYRFSCKAPLPSAPAMTQHFESVAAEPALAVEQVVAKVEAWRVAQRDGGNLRY